MKGADLWKVRREKRALRVGIDVDRVASAKEVVQAKWLEDDPVLFTLRILRMRSETNYRLTDKHADRLETLWRNTGRDWNRAESIAGLWGYYKTFRGQVSRKAGSPVAIVAERIGRAVTGVYNKVMNFRAIDPRDQRAGLEASGATDRAVWEEFYDPTSETIRTEDLEAEFERLWPEGTAGEPQSEPLEEVVSVSTGRRGQGYIADPRVRQAVEHRAMELTAALYQPPTFTKLRNTSKTRPFDFICSDAADHEIRVEVKGSTGALTECQLTVGEVNNANGASWRTDLVLVRNIRVVHTPEGPCAEGGEVRVIEDWVPKPDALKPIVYRYTMPEA